MTVQIALLRGINLGGPAKVAMADLRQAFADLAFSGAQSLLQTGNVLFQCTGKVRPRLEVEIETGLADRPGLAADVVTRSARHSAQPDHGFEDCRRPSTPWQQSVFLIEEDPHARQPRIIQHLDG